MTETSRPALLSDHPARYELANELHARPFPVVAIPCTSVYLALKSPDGSDRDRSLDRDHLIDLLDRFGAAHPAPGATHYFGQLGKHRLKWESHTEFVTYMIFADETIDPPFDARAFDFFPADWLAAAPGERITSAVTRVAPAEAFDDAVIEQARSWLVPESMAMSRVIDGGALLAGDFRIDSAGHMRFAVFTLPGVDTRRVGRVVQRLMEVETYKAMSMLGFRQARSMGSKMGDLERELTHLISQMPETEADAEHELSGLLSVASELEAMLARTTFRFGATEAYEAIVLDRIQAMREERFGGAQTFQEFMTRRYDPAMRTVKATQRRLAAMTERATRAGNLLRTRVDVERQAQNQELLESMDRRADAQLRLQRTVEGLSVVAISYYAVNLAGYMVYPAIEPLGISKGLSTALITPLVIVGVWLMIRQIRKHI